MVVVVGGWGGAGGGELYLKSPEWFCFTIIHRLYVALFPALEGELYLMPPE